MTNTIYLFVVMMIFLLLYVLIGHELMTSTLLFFILLTNLGKNNENQ